MNCTAPAPQSNPETQSAPALRATTVRHLLCVLLACFGFTTSVSAQSLNNPSATSNTVAVYEYLKNLGAVGVTGGIVLGQHAGHGNSIVLDSVNAANTYDSQVFNLTVAPIQAQTGKWPGILSLDYEFDYARSMEGLQSSDPLTDKSGLVAGNNKLKEWWNQGGLVAINWTPANPWGGANQYGYPNDYAASQTVDGYPSQPGSLIDVITAGTLQNARWRKQLDTIAAALSDLQDAGVTVLWRPMQEMDGSWFWYGYYNTYKLQGAQYRAVWVDMYDYLVNTKKLNNLIWVYSPTYGIQNGYAQSTGEGTYPGNQYVDMVAFTVYGHPLGINPNTGAPVRDVTGNNTILAYGKPMGIAEIGINKANTQISASEYITYTKATYPNASFVIAWQSFPGHSGGFEFNDWLGHQNIAAAFDLP